MGGNGFMACYHILPVICYYGASVSALGFVGVLLAHL